MTEIVSAALAEFQASSLLELTAVVLAIAYLLLAMAQRIECWYAAFISTVIFLGIFWRVNLFMESLLQVYYLVMAAYGWMMWRRGAGPESNQPGLPITRWSPVQHLAAIGLVLVLTAISGTLLQDTSQRLAYVDSFTTWGAVVTTYMVARKILENWLYWIVVDAVSIYLYIDRELYFTAALFCAYVVIVCFGYVRWRREWINNQTNG